jgi:hypothetical protein
MQDIRVVDLVVTDLDGTLWDRDGTIPPTTRKAIAELSRRGIPLVAATARRSWSAAYHFSRAGLDLPAVLLNGAIGRDIDGHGVFHRRSFGASDAAAVLEVFDRHRIMPGAFLETEEWDVVSGPNPSCGQSYLDWAGSQLRVVDDLASMLVSHPAYAFTVNGSSDYETLERLREEVADLEGVGSALLGTDSRFGGWTLHVSPSGVDKWTGIEAFAAHRGIGLRHVVAVGDGDNDVELLTRAERSFAMSHATDRARAAAQRTLAGGLDGWAAILGEI